VLVVGYPDVFPNTGKGCWPAVPVASGDVAFLRGLEIDLNRMLATEAAATGVTYVNTYTPTIGHDFCQRGSVRDVEGALPGSLTEPFHPNARGHSVMSAQVLRALG
jgi:lysophospholipase L1-like esterase